MFDEVALYPINQATTATFTDLYLRMTFVFFVEQGAKRVSTPTQDLVGKAGDLLIFPPAAFVTMENQTVLDGSYRAVGLSYPDDMIAKVFSSDTSQQPAQNRDRVQIVRQNPHKPLDLLPLVTETLQRSDLPDSVREHRLLEPLIWLKQLGLHLPLTKKPTLLSRVRSFVESDLERTWRAADVAAELGMSGPTMRRALAAEGQSFSKIIINARLEYGLTQLQTTDATISQIALASGFSTPSHFSDAFCQRFKIRPKEIRKPIA